MPRESVNRDDNPAGLDGLGNRLRTDLRALLRDGADDADLDRVIAEVWGGRDDRYSEIRSSRTANLPRVEMSYIGG